MPHTPVALKQNVCIVSGNVADRDILERFGFGGLNEHFLGREIKINSQKDSRNGRNYGEDDY